MLKPLPRPILSVITHKNERAIDWFEKLVTAINAGGGGGGGSVTDGDKGDVVVSGAGTVWLIDPAKTAADRNRANHTGTQLASTISDFSEAVDDQVSSLLVAGDNVTLSYNDVGNSLTVSAAVGSGAFEIDDGTATTGGVFEFEDGGA